MGLILYIIINELIMCLFNIVFPLINLVALGHLLD